MFANPKETEMSNKNDTAPTERPAKTERTRPIPLAERRRLMRKRPEVVTQTRMFTDWASI